MGIANTLHKVASKFEQTPGCGCAKRQQQANAIVPGSGDAIKAVAGSVAGSLHKAARLFEPKPEQITGAASVIVPRKTLIAPGNAWTVPPFAPDGWELADECPAALMFERRGCFIIWSIASGQYRNSHTQCSGPRERAEGKFRERCQTQ